MKLYSFFFSVSLWFYLMEWIRDLPIWSQIKVSPLRSFNNIILHVTHTHMWFTYAQCVRAHLSHCLWKEYHINWSEVLWWFTSWLFATFVSLLLWQKYFNKNNLKEIVLILAYISKYSPPCHGSQGFRSLKQLVILCPQSEEDNNCVCQCSSHIHSLPLIWSRMSEHVIVMLENSVNQRQVLPLQWM